MVFVQQLYTGCIAEACYYVESDGVAAVIDPLPDPRPYADLAASRGATITMVIETHFHADFVSGHVDLAKRTGATIVLGPDAKAEYDAKIATDGEVIPLGKATLTVLHTPGHTFESSCFLLKDEDGRAHCVFTGDTLFIGSVGRPDLAVVGTGATPDSLARMLFASIRTKLLPLEDHVIIYPGHGPGSSCGAGLAKETFDTLGSQKVKNFALGADVTEDAFVDQVLSAMTPAPRYFPKVNALNRGLHDEFDTVMARGARPLSVDEVQKHVDDKGPGRPLILDTRVQKDLAAGYVPKAIFAGNNGPMAPWLARVFPDLERPIVLADTDGPPSETVSRLARVGFYNVLGYLEGGTAAWRAAGKPVETIELISPEELAALDHSGLQIIDVRSCLEYKTSHVDCAGRIPLCGATIDLDSIDKTRPAYIYCRTGWRSMMFITRARDEGFTGSFVDVFGGFTALSESDAYQATNHIVTA